MVTAIFDGFPKLPRVLSTFIVTEIGILGVSTVFTMTDPGVENATLSEDLYSTRAFSYI
jgi:hypothetical protein